MNDIKKYILSVILFLIVFGLSINQVKALEDDIINDEVVVGDINQDGSVNQDDAYKLVDDILDDVELDSVNDVNKDNELNVNDVTNIIYKDKSDSWDNDLEIVDDLDISLSKDKDNIYTGDEVEVELKINGFEKDIINGIEGIIEYNKDRLELLNIDDTNERILYGSINDYGRFIYVLDNYNDISSLLKFRFVAKDIGFGIVSVKNIILSYDGVEAYFKDKQDLIFMINNKSIDDKSIDDEINNKNNNKIISIKNDYQDTKVSRPVFAISDSGKKISVSYVNISSDNYIEELIIKNYKIDFEKDKLEYNIVVDGDVNKLDLAVTLSDKNAIYEVIGNEKFKNGNNKVYIIVTAEDGSMRKYIINVKKKKKDIIKESNSSRNVIIVLLVIIVIGLIYIIFKDDEEEDNK